MDQSQLADQSTADLVKLATEQTRDLVREEITLAKSEMTEKGKQVGVGAGMFGGAAVLAFYGVGVLLAAITLALALVLPAWAAALIVAGVLFLVAAVLALLGRRHLRRGTPAAPEGAIRNVRADLDAVSTAFRKPTNGRSVINPSMRSQANRTDGVHSDAADRDATHRDAADRDAAYSETAGSRARPAMVRPDAPRTAPTRNEREA